jgi:protease-4
MRTIGRAIKFVWVAFRSLALLLGFGLIGLAIAVLVIAPWDRGDARVPDGAVLDISYRGKLSEKPVSGNLLRLAQGRGLSVFRMNRIIRQAALDDRIAVLAMDLSGAQVPLAHAEELAEAVAIFRQSGKQTYAFSTGWNLGRYRLASAFQNIAMPPSGDFSVGGLALISPYGKDLADNLGLQPQIEKRKSYKSAADFMTEQGMSRDLRQANQVLLDDLKRSALNGIALARKAQLTRWNELEAPLKIAFWRPDLAHKFGFMDRLIHRDEFYEGIGSSTVKAAKYAQFALRGNPDAAATIALIAASGTIKSGRSNPLDAGTITDISLIKDLQRAANDETIAAILIRVDSPGGGYTPSDAIARIIANIDKPVVVSMGPVAGSGGYMIAMAADRIVAEPSTITGSIGVIGGKIAINELLADWGVNVETVRSGPHGGINSPLLPYNSAQQTLLSQRIDTIYAEFTAAVATHRDLTAEQAEAAAQGRIWTGRQAMNLGLVDRLGGVLAGIDEVVKLLELESDGAINVVEYPRLSNAQRLSSVVGLQLQRIQTGMDWFASPETALEQIEARSGIRAEMPAFQIR